ncbi:hypothetical protein DAPPUDRAFT_242364 [Daphnia pulex]|uniref:Uncharacterized protein n=1 Tax=Daphnia pulex TaxID=6669 RepID=E9GGH0_DAPPU|nr:hypothetical protein DAPPUDRAFT_242364 [Daphnia pulex]|eukprot:EFX81501.1 hypothetical protein DAPPUDRAFT_242364 [Daphnia pulex]
MKRNDPVFPGVNYSLRSLLENTELIHNTTNSRAPQLKRFVRNEPYRTRAPFPQLHSTSRSRLLPNGDGAFELLRTFDDRLPASAPTVVSWGNCDILNS